MTHYRDWHRDPHVPITNAEQCGHRDPAEGHHCTRAKGHTGRHHWAWQHHPAHAGRVRKVWD